MSMSENNRRENFEHMTEIYEDSDIKEANKVRQQLPNLFLSIDTEFNFYNFEKKAEVSVAEEGEKLIRWIDNFCNDVALGAKSGEIKKGFVKEVDDFAESLRETIREDFIGSDAPKIDEVLSALRRLHNFMHEWQDKHNITRIDGTDKENEGSDVILKEADMYG